MSDKHEHKRDGEMLTEYHERESDEGMPQWAKGIATFVNRVGFPIFAFIVMTYFCFMTLEKNTKAIQELKDVMISVKDSLDRK